MPSKTLSAAVVGLKAQLVEVEVDVLRGLHVFNIVGLPDAAVREAKDRVGAAIKNSGAKPPHHCGRLTVNLAPADLKKIGPAYDLPIAVGILRATRQIPCSNSREIFLGELALDGTLRHAQGILSIALLAQEQGIKSLYLPEANAAEASLVEGLEIIPVQNLAQLLSHLNGQSLLKPYQSVEAEQTLIENDLMVDLAQVRGQEQAKRALEIAAAGGHNFLMNGPPGAGKTLLAKALPSILPAMTKEESLAVTQIYSVAGLLSHEEPLVKVRPFRSPHHSASAVALVGGGPWPRPGEISLAHRGVLFLDELPEFSRVVLENLRQPLEDGLINISRASMSLQFPARFTLVAAKNPCPCGYLTDPERECRCLAREILRYERRISGPLLDRLDLYLEVPRVKFSKLISEARAESSSEVRARVEQARGCQEERFENLAIFTNEEMNSAQCRQFCPLDIAGEKLAAQAVVKLKLSARGYFRLLKVARTIADLEGTPRIQSRHLAEALQYRLQHCE